MGMSRKSGPKPAFRLLSCSVGALGCGIAVACGGTQGAAPASTETPVDAGVDATLGQLDPAFADPCQAAAVFTYQPLASFDDEVTSPGGNPNDLAGPYAPYVSYDLSGTLYECYVPGELPPLGNILPEEDAAVTDPALCMTGYQPSTVLAQGIGEVMPVSHCGSQGYGLHLRAKGLTDWGMNIGIDLRQNCNNTTTAEAGAGHSPACFFDATGWKGVSFWARLGFGDYAASDGSVPVSTDARSTTLLITAGDPGTSNELGGGAGVPIGSYPFNGPPDGGPPVCGSYPCLYGEPDANLDAGVLPCDPFGQGVALPTASDGGPDSWQFYAIPFSAMRQKGYGAPESALDLGHILNVTINLSKGQLGAVDYDVWIDDIAFYK